MFKYIDKDARVEITQYNVRGVEDNMIILKQFLYNVGDKVKLRHGIKVGTYCGGVNYSIEHKANELNMLTIKDRVLDKSGNYYIVESNGELLRVTDTMIDQLKTKAYHYWESKDTPLTCIIGRTASGKDTFANLLANDPDKIIKSYTTRPRRKGEGDTHKFIDSIEDYEDRWVESEINGYNYFVLEEDIIEKDILIVDPVGFKSLMSQPEFTREVEVYYLMVDPLTRMNRYIKRESTVTKTPGIWGDYDGSQLLKCDFIERNGSEDSQFTAFEKLLENSYFRKKYNIEVLSSGTLINQPHHKKLYWGGNYCEHRKVGGWTTNKGEVEPINPIEEVNDYIEYILTEDMRGGDNDEK